MAERDEAIPRYPLAWPMGWPRTPRYKQQRASFKSFRQAVSVYVGTQRLETQLDMLGARNPTLSTNLSLRLDGRPRTEGEPDDPGAAVYFTFKGKATTMACDRWDRVADNIAAIAAHVDALRRVDRYGVGSLEQALAGYKALPADTAADWRKVLGFPTDARVSAEAVHNRYRELSKATHPDTPDGNHEMFIHLGRAKEFALAEILA